MLGSPFFGLRNSQPLKTLFSSCVCKAQLTCVLDLPWLLGVFGGGVTGCV